MEHPLVVALFLFCPVAIAAEGYPICPPLPIAEQEVMGAYYPTAHQRVALVTPMHRGINGAICCWQYTQCIEYSRESGEIDLKTQACLHTADLCEGLLLAFSGVFEIPV